MNEHIVHVPVLLNEIVRVLKPEPNSTYVDGTVGQGGHAEALLTASLPDVRLLAFDRDPQNLAIAEARLARFGQAVVFIHDSFATVKKYAYEHGFTSCNGILLDLGFSSAHVEDPERGFSFQHDGPLDMRYDPSTPLTAEIVVNEWDEEELARIFRIYGEERAARTVAEAIVRVRNTTRITSTSQLAQLVEMVIRRRGKTHPATKIFQAIRIAVNDEFGHIETGLPDMVDLLAPGGRLAIISFHSLEDRMIKHFFKSRDDLKILTKKPITASEEELKSNPRARSAKLRVAEKI